MSINRHERSGSNSNSNNNNNSNNPHNGGSSNENGSSHSGSTGSVNSIGTSGSQCGYAVPLHSNGPLRGSNHQLASLVTGNHYQSVQASQAAHHMQNTIPLNAIRTQAATITSKHVRSRSAVDPLISYGVVANSHPASHLYTQHSSHNHNSLLAHHKNSVSSLTTSSNLLSSLSSPGGPQFSLLSSVEEKVSRLYYRHGLVISRHPIKVILLCLLIVLFSSYPIVTYSGLFGSSSEIYITSSNPSSNHNPLPTFSPKSVFHRHEPDKSSSIANSILLQTETDSFLKHLYFWKNSNTDHGNGFEHDSNLPNVPHPGWFEPNLSYAFVQQIYVRSAVIPWSADMQLVDALRGPFEVLFELIESISNYQLHNNATGEDINLSDVCLQVFEPMLGSRYAKLASHLPSYSCLMLSPANIWRDFTRFQSDPDFLSTLLKYKDTTSSPLPSGALHNLFFGVQFDETGIRRTYGRNRQRTITYAITIAMRRHSPQFIDGLRTFLLERYPLSVSYYRTGEVNDSSSGWPRDGSVGEGHPQDLYHISNETLHIFYMNTFTVKYMIPLLLSYLLVCLYIYFSVRKIEIVRYKLLYGFCALCTVFLSVFMSFGICLRLNFNSVLIVNWLLPYFVAGIGFENMLVLTKSVTTQFQHLDPKVRVAQGLATEGLSITKNLLAMLTLLTIGSFAFVQIFRDCCIFAAVCLLVDFFIQVTFFIAFISINMQPINARSIKKSNKDFVDKSALPYPKNIYARPGKPELKKTPKRLRIIYFFARIRIVQRCFFLLLMSCIGFAIYNAYMLLDQPTIAEELRPVAATVHNNSLRAGGRPSMKQQQHAANRASTVSSSVIDSSSSSSPNGHGTQLAAEDGIPNSNHHSLIELLKASSPTSEPNSFNPSSSSSLPSHTPTNPYGRIHFTCDHPVSSMPNHHWSNLLSLYNISMTGRFVSILPPILLSIPITPERAQSVRNVADSDDEMLKKFVPMKFSNGEYVIVDDDFDEYEQLPRMHFFSTWSRADLYIIIGLSIPSFIFFIYIFILCYRCVCTRNYAEWRTQLSSSLRQQFNPLDYVTSLMRRTTGTGGYHRLDQMEKFFHFDIRMLTIDREVEHYPNENQYMLNNQDISLIATGGKKDCLVATSSMSSDIRVYDPYALQTLIYIKRSKSNGHCHSPVNSEGKTNNWNGQVQPPVASTPSPTTPLRNRFIANSSSASTSTSTSSSLVARTSGNVLKTIVDGISVEDDNGYQDDCSSNGEDCPLGGLEFQPVWCLDIFDRYVLAGCGIDGRLEVWDGKTGELAYVHYPDHHDLSNDSNSASITAMKVTYWGVAIARINGTLDLLEVDHRKDIQYSLGSNSRTFSMSGHNHLSPHNNEQQTCHSLMETNRSIKYRIKHTIQAHQQPVTRMEIIDSLEDEDFIKTFGARGCLITGSLDNTLKVFSLDQAKFVYTLNGHCGGISITAIDQYSTATALSGCQLGQLFVWDLNTGTCIFSMQAHSQAEVLAITTSQLYYVSSGTDNRICVWDRYSGQLVHQIPQQHSNCRNMMFLEAHILVTVRDAELVVWDVNDARQVCIVSLADQSKDKPNKGGHAGGSDRFDSLICSYQTASIQRLCFANNRQNLICDYGNSLCVINNPFAEKKLD